VSNSIYTELAWLPAAPADFKERCRAVTQMLTGQGAELRALATHALDQNQLNRLAKVTSQAREESRDLRPLVPFRLGLLSNCTTDFVVPALIGTAARHGIALEVVAGDYGQPVQQAMDARSAVNRAKPAAVLLALDYRALPLRNMPGDTDAARSMVNAAVETIGAMRAAIRANSGAVCLVQTLAPPAEPLFGSMDRALEGTTYRNILDINGALAKSLEGSSDVLVDVARIAETVGLADWHSPQEWNLAKLPFSDALCPLYAEMVCRAIAALRGKTRRCLVLDLDNTVWGGVIGDDGLAGIRVAEGDATGEAHRAVQRMALELRERGVVLAVCSKNEDENARLPFREHPEMLLREKHIAVFQANWKDKPANIRAIAEELSLGLESLVFLDDNPVERGHMRKELPEVAVPELPSDPALYARTLAAAGYFEAVTFSREDKERAQFFEDNARRLELQKQSGNVGEYLRSLNMEIFFQPFDETGRARISQLINKSNQYNLTTRRYNEAQVAELEADPSCFTLQVRLTDTFGDNGMISVVICREQEPDEWEIDTWLMSCRVLGRCVEQMVLQHVVEQARKRGIHKLKGTYIRTDRNKLVEDHYAKLGFTTMGEETDGRAHYELLVEEARFEEPLMTVVEGIA
jgi:FkbH-like protein